MTLYPLTANERRVVDLLSAAWRFSRRGTCQHPPTVFILTDPTHALRLVSEAAAECNDTVAVARLPKASDRAVRHHKNLSADRGFILHVGKPREALLGAFRLDGRAVLVFCGDEPPPGVVVADPSRGPEDAATFDQFAEASGFKARRAE